MSKAIELPNLAESKKPGFVNEPEVFNDLDEIIPFDISNLETDIGEIKQRQDVFKAIFENPAHSKQISIMPDNPRLYTGYDSVREYANKGTDFYRNVLSTLVCISSLKNNNSVKLKNAAKKLEKILKLKKGEKKLMKDIAEEAKGCHKFAGRLKIQGDTYSLTTVESEWYGFRVYPMKKSERRPVHQRPRSIETDIEDYLSKKLYNHKFRSELTDLARIGLIVDYTYSEEGINIGVGLDHSTTRLCSYVSTKANQVADFVKSKLDKPWTYTESKSRLRRLDERIGNWMNYKIERKKMIRLTERARENAENNILSKNEVKIHSLSGIIPNEHSKNEYMSISLNEIVEKYSTQIEHYQKAREEFGKFISNFRGFFKTALYFMDKSKKGYPITFPKINPARKRELKIKNLYPMRLIDQIDNAVPNDVYFNGKPTLITGPNNGGKSVYLLSVNDAIIMAQAGLPLIAESAEMSVKDALFLHFIKDTNVRRGESTFKSSMERFKSLFLELSKYQNPHITADELAAGTDPQSAYNVSERITRALSGISSKASSHIVTQFTDVARMAAKDYDINAMKVECYKLVPGIGYAKGLELAEKIGLTEEFIDDVIKQNKAKVEDKK